MERNGKSNIRIRDLLLRRLFPLNIHVDNPELDLEREPTIAAAPLAERSGNESQPPEEENSTLIAHTIKIANREQLIAILLLLLLLLCFISLYLCSIEYLSQ
eukprot:gene9041-6342_t